MTLAFLDHHLDNWHAKVFLGLLREQGHEVVAYETDPIEGDWCAAHGVPRAGSLDDAIDQADGIMLLAPDDIESHLDLALAAIPSGKPLWVDKLLAPTYDEAIRITRAAEYHSTPLTSGSSLRHAVELEDALYSLPLGRGRNRVDGLSESASTPFLPSPREERDHSEIAEGFLTGYGTWERYGVHTVAMALRAMGSGVTRLLSTGTEAMPTVVLEWADGRRATLVVAQGEGASTAFPWRFALRRDGAYTHGTVTDFEGFYRRQLDAILRDFETKSSHPYAEMLDTARILGIVPDARDQGWIVL